MTDFDFTAMAELYPRRAKMSKREPVSYKRFDTAAEAIRYAVEELHPDLLLGAVLEVDEERFDSEAIMNLYTSSEFPLPRKAGAGEVER
jgi:hypothetical protein